MLNPLYQYRRLIWDHAIADFRHRYAGSGLGWLWNVVHPLGMVAVYGAVFTGIFKRTMPDVAGPFAYTLFLCAGLFPWIGFSETLTRGSTIFQANARYLKKLPIPEQVFAAQGALSATFGLIISMVLLVILALITGLAPAWQWLLVPLPLVLMQATALGLGTALGAVNVFFNDVSQILVIALQVLFWVAPIVYPAEIAPLWFQWVMAFHPLTPVVHATRELFIYHRLPGPATWIAMSAWAAASVAIGLAVLRALRSEIRDVI